MMFSKRRRERHCSPLRREKAVGAVSFNEQTALKERNSNIRTETAWDDTTRRRNNNTNLQL